MPRNYLRSLFYNLFFYGLTAIACFLCLPALLLPRRWAMALVIMNFVRINAWLEHYVLGLRYEIRGAQNVPQDGSFIIGAKHQSAYETMKLHMLFKDPAIVLKKELLSIPLWGWYLKKSDVIAIDRTTPEAAIQSIQDGARRMQAQGRPIVIFPQGTRVSPQTAAQSRPYKVGIARVQEATNLPIIPMAMNAGMFWGRNAFWKSSGTVVFEFLPAIPSGLNRADVLAKLQTAIEPVSEKLMNEALDKSNKPEISSETKAKKKPIFTIVLISLLALLSAGYSALWFKAGHMIQEAYVTELAQKTTVDPATITLPKLSGFPGRIHITKALETISAPGASITVNDISYAVWPLPIPGLPMEFSTGEIIASPERQSEGKPITIDSVYARFTTDGKVVDIQDSAITKDALIIQTTGSVDVSDRNKVIPELLFTITGHDVVIKELIAQGVLQEKSATFIQYALGSFVNQETGDVEIEMAVRNDTLYLGPIPVMSYNEIPGGEGAAIRRKKPLNQVPLRELNAPAPPLTPSPSSQYQKLPMETLPSEQDLDTPPVPAP